MSPRRPVFRRLDYSLYEALMRSRFPGSTLQVVLAVIDACSYPDKREGAHLSLTKLQEKTGLTRQGVVRAVKDAEARAAITVRRAETRDPRTGSSFYSINRDYHRWTAGPQCAGSGSQRGLPSELGNDGGLAKADELVNGSIQDWSTVVDETSQRPLRATSPTPQEEPSKKHERKGTCTPQDPLESAISELPKWGSWTADDRTWLGELRIDHSDATPADVRDCRDRWLARAKTHTKGQWKTRLRNWLRRKGEFGGGNGSATSGPRKPWRGLPGNQPSGAFSFYKVEDEPGPERPRRGLPGNEYGGAFEQYEHFFSDDAPSGQVDGGGEADGTAPTEES